MKWSWRIGRILGIDIYMHATFPLLVLAAGFYVLLHPLWPQSWALPAMLTVLGLFGMVLLHEYGHALAARYFGIRVSHITLLPIGGYTAMEGMPDEPVKEMTVALAGPFVNLIITVIMAVIGAVGLMIEAQTGMPLPGRMWFLWLFMANALLFVLNLLPLFPMDGGYVLRAILATSMDNLAATTAAVMIGRVLAVIGFFVAIRLQDPIMMIFIFFIWHLGSQRLMHDRARAHLDNFRVRELMSTTYATLPSHISLDLAAQQARDGQRYDFPVLERGALVGMLSYPQIERWLQQQGDGRVSDAMRRDFPIAHPDEGVGSVIARLQGGDLHSIPVIEADHMAGLLSIEAVVEKLRAEYEASTQRRRSLFPWRRKRD